MSGADAARRLRYALVTFGCRTNQADSFDVERDLRARGGERAPVEAADLVVVNTCAVTATAEQAARQAIRRVARINPRARIVAIGCYATRQAADLASLPVWRIVGNGEGRGNLARSDDSVPSGPPSGRVEMPGPGTQGRTIGLLRVQTGCDEACAYCVVPSTRGRSRSTPPGAILEQVSDAVRAGFKELTLTGVHLGSYGRDLVPLLRLSDLVRALSEHPCDIRFRLSAIEPMDFDGDLIEAVAGSGRFAPCFHLPLQHASDGVLSAMRRPYTLDQYDATVRRLRERFPDAAIGADLIVGFPGETEADFEICERYLAGSPLTSLHVFPFSPRPGTPAAQMSGRPAGEDVRRRVGALRSVGNDLGRRFRDRFVGAVRDGLTIEDGTWVMTDNRLRVRIPPGRARNERVRVRIEQNEGELKGFLVPAEDDRSSV